MKTKHYILIAVALLIIAILALPYREGEYVYQIHYPDNYIPPKEPWIIAYWKAKLHIGKGYIVKYKKSEMLY